MGSKSHVFYHMFKEILELVPHFFFLMILLNLLILLNWKCNDKKRSAEISEFSVPLEYWRKPTQYLKLKVSRLILIKSNEKQENLPVFILGPGMGRTNIAKSFDTFTQYINNTNFYMIGYRGIDSEPSFSDSDIKSLVSIDESKIDDALLTRIANKTLGRLNISEFWNPQRARDVIEFMKEEKIEKANLLTIGETGSLVAHQLLSDYPDYFERCVIVGSSVPSENHNETSVRLLGTYRRLCRADPVNCPYKNIRWLPHDIPSTILLAFKVSKERVTYITEQQLRAPHTAPTAFDILQSITDNSNMGYMAFNTIPGPEAYKYKWIDVAMHMCSKPFDKSFFAPAGIKHICPYYPNFSTKFNNKFITPILLVIGELDLPRQKYVVEFYKNNSVSPDLVDSVFLNKTSSVYEFGRKDVAEAISSYLKDGNTKFNIDQNIQIVWRNGFSMTKMVKYALIGTGAVTLIAALYLYKKDYRNDRRGKDISREKWLQEERMREELIKQENQKKQNKPKKQQKQMKDKRK